MSKLTTRLCEQLNSIDPSVDENNFLYFPCEVVCEDGTVHPRVYVTSRNRYIEIWGDDSSRQHLDIASVRSFQSSPDRLKPELATTAYSYGESAMGGRSFVLVDRMGRRYGCQTGDAVDFITFPRGLKAGDIVDVAPMVPDDPRLEVTPELKGAPYLWCVY